jgi:hypothetical protein
MHGTAMKKNKHNYALQLIALSFPLYSTPAAICSPACYLTHSTKHVAYTHISATTITFLEMTTATHISVTSPYPFIPHGCPISALCSHHFVSVLTSNIHSFPQFLFHIFVKRLLTSSCPFVCMDYLSSHWTDYR